MSVRRQCEILGFNRASVYYKPRIKNESFLENEIIKIYNDKPFYGYRKTRMELIKNNIIISGKKVRKIRKKLNLKTIYPSVSLSYPNKEHKKYPYLLKNYNVTAPNQVWQTDITYLKLKTGFAYLCAVIDIFSRKTLSHRISNTADVKLCAETMEQAISLYGTPDIANQDQGSRFTSLEYTELLKNNNIKISMDYKGRAIDNIYIERLFRSLKYENVYLRRYETLPEAKEGIADYFNFYNAERFHQSLNYKTPDEIYNGSGKEAVSLNGLNIGCCATSDILQ